MGAVGYTGGDPGKVDIAGDTMTGPLILSGDPVVALGAATKQFAESQGGGGGSGIPATTVTSETLFGIAPVVGTGTKYARDDHTHGSPTAPTAASVGASPTGHNHTGTYDPSGSATAALASALSADVLLSSSTPTAEAFGDTGSVGVATTSAHGDHRHAMPAAPTAASVGAQPLDSDLTTIAGLTATTDNMIQSVASAWASRTPAQVKTALALNNLDNTSDANKPVSTAQQIALNLKADLAGPTFTGTPAAPTAAGATNTTQLATTAFVQTAAGLLVPKSLFTTKGDIAVATAANTPARLGVGADTFVLTADSAQASGVKWAAAAGGGSSGVGAAVNPLGGRWQPIPIGRAGSNYTPVINRLHLIPLPIGPTARQITGVSFEIATAAGVGGLGRACLFSSLSTWEPNVEIIDWGTKITTGTGALTWTALTQNVSANTLYWLGFNPTVAAPVMRGVDGYNPYVNLNAAVTGTTSFGMFIMNSVSASTGASPFVYFDVDLAIRGSVQFA